MGILARTIVASIFLLSALAASGDAREYRKATYRLIGSSFMPTWQSVAAFS